MGSQYFSRQFYILQPSEMAYFSNELEVFLVYILIVEENKTIRNLLLEFLVNFFNVFNFNVYFVE